MLLRLTPSFQGRRYWCFVCAILLLILLTPLAQSGLIHRLFLGGYMTFLLGLGMVINSDTRTWRIWCGALCLLNISLFAGDLLTDHPAFIWAMKTLWFVYLIVLGYQILLAVVRSDTVDSDVLFGSVSIYLLGGLVFALAYWSLEIATPGSFNLPADNVPKDGQRPDLAVFQYYSFVTLTTVGFGDITARSGIARALTVLEALFGVLFIAVFLGRMLSLYMMHSVTRQTKNGS